MSETAQETVTAPQPTNPFDDSSWVSSSTEAQNQVEEPAQSQETDTNLSSTKVSEESQQDDVEFVDADEYLKSNLGYSNWDEAKNDIEQLKKLKEQPSSFDFQNEQSKKIFEAIKNGNENEIYEYLNNKKQIDRIEKLDIGNPENASELIKLNLRLKHQELDDSEIVDLFKENYEKPLKPEQSLSEDDDEYNERLNNWKSKCDFIDRKIVRDAKIMRTEFTQLASQKIVLPDIPQMGNETKVELTQEDLTRQQAFRDSFVSSAKSAINDLNEFSVSVNDGEVNLTVGYGFSQEEKSLIDNQINNFVENGYDANALFAERWLNDNGTINSKQMVKDLSLLYNEGKISQKLVQEAANKRLEGYLREKKNINVNTQDSRQSFDPSPTKTEAQGLQDWAWEQS